MKKNRILFLLLFLIISCSAILLGCNTDKRLIGDTREEYEAAGSQKVTLYYNGGMEGSNTELTYFVDKGGRLPMPGKGSVAAPKKLGYQLEGWYKINENKYLEREEYLNDVFIKDGVEHVVPKLNVKNEHAKQTVYYIEGHDFTNNELEVKQYAISATDLEAEQANYNAGNLLAGDRIFASYEPWSFDFDKFDDDTVLVAIWGALRYYMLVPPENKNDNFDEEGYGKLEKYSLNAAGAVIRPTNSMVPVRKGYQLEGFYKDSAFRKPVVFDSANKYYPDNDLGENDSIYVDGSTEIFKIVPIYVKYLEAKYKIVNSVSDLSPIATNGIYYINKDLDFSDNVLTTPEVFSGEIAGNGKVWKNLTMTVSQTIKKTGEKDLYGGIFKTLSGANISKITFENLTIRFERKGDELDSVDWNREIDINIFARDIDSTKTTIIRNVVLGSEDDKVKLVVAEGLREGGKLDLVMTEPRLSEQGNVYLYAEELARYVTPEEGEDWPEYTWRKTYMDKFDYEAVLFEYDEKPIYGYQEIDVPEGAAYPRFVETIFSSGDENVIDCTIFGEKDDTDESVWKTTPNDPMWREVYGPGMAAPESPGNIKEGTKTYNFVGWFRKVEKTAGKGDFIIEYISYEFQDVSVEASEEMTLYAMWSQA